MAQRATPANFQGLELGLAAFVAVAAQVAFVALLSASEPTTVTADISDENSKPMSVAITPVVDEAPLLKLGSKKKAVLPDMWQKPKPVPVKTKQKEVDNPATISSSADPNAKPPPDAGPVEAGVLAVDAAEVAKTDQPPLDDAGPAPAMTNTGSAAGDKNGTEEDELKGEARDRYKQELSAWFSARFNIKGKVPFDELKSLVGRAVVSISPDRKVTAFTTTPSGNAVFDAELQKCLSGIQASGALVPAPPPMYPDLLKGSASLKFDCTKKALCE